MLKLTGTILCHIGKQIRNGDALHALFILNEYLGATDPLRLAFVARAQDYLAQLPNPLKQLVTNAVAGARLNSLSTDQQTLFHQRRSLLAPRREWQRTPSARSRVLLKAADRRALDPNTQRNAAAIGRLRHRSEARRAATSTLQASHAARSLARIPA